MNTGAGGLHRFMNDRVQAEFIAATMQAEFQIGGQAVTRDRVGDDREVVVKLAFKGHQISDVIDAFIKATGELWRDGLHANFFIGQGGKNDQQFWWSLREIGFVHRHLGDDVGFTFGGANVTVDARGFLRGEQIFRRGVFNVCARRR